jgi:hypothetical protein
VPQVEPPLQIGAAGGPQTKAPVFADDLHCDIVFGDVGDGDQSLPAAPAGRLRGFPTGDMSDLRVQTIGTDQQIPVRAGAVFELDPHPVLGVERRSRADVASDAIGWKALQQTVKQDAARNHPDGSAQPVDDRVQGDVDQWMTSGRRDPHGGQQLTRTVHVDAQLLQNR